MAKIKVTNAYLEILTSMAPVIDGLRKKALPAKMAFHIALVMQSANDAVKAFVETKKSLLTRHFQVDKKTGELKRDKQGQLVPVLKKGSIEVANKEMVELLNTEVELPIEKLILATLKDVPNITVEETQFLVPLMEI